MVDVTHGTERLAEVVRVLDDEQIPVAEPTLRRPMLDDIFIRLTGNGAVSDAARATWEARVRCDMTTTAQADAGMVGSTLTLTGLTLTQFRRTPELIMIGGMLVRYSRSSKRAAPAASHPTRATAIR